MEGLSFQADGGNDPRLDRARQHAARGEVLQAESLLRAVLAQYPACLAARLGLAGMIADRDDAPAALALLQSAPASDDPALPLAIARLHWSAGDPAAARTALESMLAAHPDHYFGWLMLGEANEVLGDTLGALRARHRAFDQAQRQGRWTNEQTTEPALLKAVLSSMQRFREVRRERLMAIVEAGRERSGSLSMARVERALTGYLREWDATPPDPRQRPKFFYFPDLPPGPYHDPNLQPWCRTLQDAWPEIRAEALALLPEAANFEDFLGLKPGQKSPTQMGGAAENPAWDAFFFYRHAKRYDEHHRRAPITSALLESIELCRVDNQAPEILFSVLRPQSTILPHHGVTNTRLVFHLPLLVPPGCALNLVDHGEHAWREGEPMMFDDTYLHEAWNRSDHNRVILLMDCWNPHLDEAEKHTVREIVEAIDAIEN
jgi:aspartate beta-hydroxylase